MIDLNSTLSEFNPISLQEMDDVALQDRTDTKFAFSETNLLKYLDVLKEDYRVLDIDGVRSTPYNSLYFDNDNFDLYMGHHNQKLNRFKVRYRQYVGTDLVFFEVKFKTNTGRTIKKRIKNDGITFSLEGNIKELFEDITKLPSENFLPRLWVNYKRTTFVSTVYNERVTIDTFLTFHKGNSINAETASSLDGLVIAEVKQKKMSFNSPFVRMMHHQHVRKLSVSKYCLGVTTLHPEMKSNNFKTKILTINKIIHGTNCSITGL